MAALHDIDWSIDVRLGLPRRLVGYHPDIHPTNALYSNLTVTSEMGLLAYSLIPRSSLSFSSASICRREGVHLCASATATAMATRKITTLPRPSSSKWSFSQRIASQNGPARSRGGSCVASWPSARVALTW